MLDLRKLKSLFNIEINKPIINIEINKSQSDSKEYIYKESEKKLEIFLDNLSSEKKKQFKPFIRDAIDGDCKLFEKETAELLDRLYQYKSNPGEDTKIKKFFENIILPHDYEALESALYLRKEFSNCRNISKLKKDIRRRFGDRGSNIANLCTAGYFEEFLQPLYNDSPNMFKELYELIVDKGILAVFVHKNMSPDIISDQISTKIQTCQKYGIKFFHIHGLGKTNINTIKNFIEGKRDFFKFFEKKIYESGDKDLIIVEILL